MSGEMVLTGVYVDLRVKTSTPPYRAVWKLPSGNVIHDRLPGPMFSDEEAIAYALKNKPSW